MVRWRRQGHQRVRRLGGMDALVAAAKKEGTLNVIALPPDWANYGAIIKASGQVRHQDQLGQPQRHQPGRDQRLKQLKGTDRAPDVARRRHGRRAGQHRSSSRPTRSRPGPTSRPARRTRPASGSRTTAASCRSATTRPRCPTITRERPARARRSRARSRSTATRPRPTPRSTAS